MKKQKKLLKRIQGSISLLLVIILLPTLTVAGLLVDIARTNLGTAMISSAGDLSLQSALANYDTVLKDVYGLFAMSQNQTSEELNTNIRRYFEETLLTSGIVSKEDANQYMDQLLGDLSQSLLIDDVSMADFFKMDIDQFTVSKPPQTNLANPSALKNQIIEYMKYRAPIEFSLGFIDSIKNFAKIDRQTKVVEKKLEAETYASELMFTCKRLYDQLVAVDYILQKGSFSQRLAYFRQEYQLIHQRLFSNKSEITDPLNTAFDPIREEISTKLSMISGQAQELTEDLQKLEKQLADIQLQIPTVKQELIKYKEKINAWELANQYYSEQGVDSFSKNNRSEIIATTSLFDEKAIDSLVEFVTQQSQKVSQSVNFLQKETTLTYAGEKISKLTDLNVLLGKLNNTTQWSDTIGNLDVQATDSIFSTLYFLETLDISIKSFTNDSPILPFTLFLMQSCSPLSNQSDQTASENLVLDYTALKSVIAEKPSEITAINDSPYHYSYQTKEISSAVKASLPSAEVNSFAEIVNETGQSPLTLYQSQMKIGNGLLAGLEKVLAEERDDLFVIEYLFNHFSYNTLIQDLVKKAEPSQKIDTMDISQYLDQAETQTHVKINSKNNYLYGGEIEYVLYGSDKPVNNVRLAEISIFALRFLFNSIYAFTDSEIRNTAISVGMAVQAATLGAISYTTVQTVMQIALALAETAYDLHQMMKGEKIAIMKSKESWVFSPSGATNSLVDVLKNSTENLVHTVSDKFVVNGLQRFIDAKEEELTAASTDLIANLATATTAKTNEVINVIYNKIEGKLREQLNQLTFIDYSQVNVQVEQKIDHAFTQITNEISNLPQSFTDTISRQIISTVMAELNHEITQIKQELLASVSSAIDINTIIIDKVFAIKQNFSASISRKINDLSDKVSAEIASLISGITEKIQNNLLVAGEEGKVKVIQLVNSYIDQTFNDSVDRISSSLNTSTIHSNNALGTVLVFGYRDYLKLFSLIALVHQEEAILKRIADVIQLNLANAPENSELAHPKGTAFLMKDANTFVTITTRIHLSMYFFNMGVFTGSNKLCSKRIDYQDFSGY